MRLTLAAMFMALSTVGAGLSSAQAQPPSGMLLGVYAFTNWRGLYVTDTIPGYSAEGRLFRGDVLRRVTVDGIHIYPTRTIWQLEEAKDHIGPHRMAALEIERPGAGLIYLWVEFRPVGGGPVVLSAPATAGEPRPRIRRKMTARIYTERERPGAARLFRRGPATRPANPPTVPGEGPHLNHPARPIPTPPIGHPGGGAASLFGRR